MCANHGIGVLTTLLGFLIVVTCADVMFAGASLEVEQDHKEYVHGQIIEVENDGLVEKWPSERERTLFREQTKDTVMNDKSDYNLIHFDDKAPIEAKNIIQSVVSIKPVSIVPGTYDGKGVRVKGLKPATGFIIDKRHVGAALHTIDQSQHAFIRTLDSEGNFSDKYQAKSHEIIYGKQAKVIIRAYTTSNEHKGDTEIPYDFGCYQTEEEIQDRPSLQIQSEKPSIGTRVILIGIPFSSDKDYSIEYSIGYIKNIVQSSGQPYLMLIDARTREGYSGGPVVNLDNGKVLGIIMGEYEFPPHLYTVAWSLPPSGIL